MLYLKALAEAVIKGDQNTAVQLTKSALQQNTPAKRILDEGLIAGMDTIGELFKNYQIYIPEVLIAARAMKTAMEVLEPELVKAGVEPLGRFIIGTAQYDVHDIGKNLVAMMLKGAGFDVTDLGVDVAPEKFVERAKAVGTDFVGISALLTPSLRHMEKTIIALKEAGVKAKVLIGGAPVTQGYADKIGADGYAPDAASAVDLAKSLLNHNVSF